MRLCLQGVWDLLDCYRTGLHVCWQSGGWLACLAEWDRALVPCRMYTGSPLPWMGSSWCLKALWPGGRRCHFVQGAAKMTTVCGHGQLPWCLDEGRPLVDLPVRPFIR